MVIAGVLAQAHVDLGDADSARAVLWPELSTRRPREAKWGMTHLISLAEIGIDELDRWWEEWRRHAAALGVTTEELAFAAQPDPLTAAKRLKDVWLERRIVAGPRRT